MPIWKWRFAMSRIIFAISLMSLLACGAGESDQAATGSASDEPAVSAKMPATDDAKGAAVKQAPVADVKPAETNDNSVIVRSCLGLVASGEFETALPVCVEAASIDSKNAEVQAALAKAQAETAAKAASGAATDAAAKALGGVSN